MSPRVLAVLGLGVLLGLFAIDRGEPIASATVFGGCALALRFWIWRKMTGRGVTDPARRSLNATLVGVLWLGCLAILATDWLPADTFLPIALLGGTWFILDKEPGRYIDTMLVAVICIAAWVVLNVVSLPDVVTLPCACLVAVLLLMAFSRLDSARVAEAMGDAPADHPIQIDSVALLLLVLVTVPVASFLPLAAPTTEEPIEWSQSLGSIVGFTDSVDLTQLGLLKTNDSHALNVRVWDVVEGRADSRGWRSVGQWTGGRETRPDRHELLLRGAALGRWDGSTFTRIENPRPQVTGRADQPLDDKLGFSLVRQEIELGAHGQHTLFALERAIGGSKNVRLTGGELRAIEPVVRKTEYRVVSRVLPPAHRHRLQGRRVLDADRRYLSTEGVSQAIRDVAHELAARSGSEGAYSRATFIEDWFTKRTGGGDFRYTRRNRNSGANPIETFLAETRSGHCAFFATAMVLMLRSLDIPARLAVGFRGGTWSDRARAFRVLQKNAHAWVEVPFVGAGWIPFDPTPPESTLDLAAPEGGRAGYEPESSLVPLLEDAEKEPGLPVESLVFAILGAGLVVMGAWILHRRERLRSAGVLSRPEGSLQARVVRITTHAGATRRRSATLREMVGQATALPSASLPDLLRVVAWLYRARYGARPLGADESSEAGRILLAVERELDS